MNEGTGTKRNGERFLFPFAWKKVILKQQSRRNPTVFGTDKPKVYLGG
jgi:hypothetical protein